MREVWQSEQIGRRPWHKFRVVNMARGRRRPFNLTGPSNDHVASYGTAEAAIAAGVEMAREMQARREARA